ncbi:hypothetical protein OHA40_21740 [Nocardia sp. NBC_00508]|uniref:hypothetical protein n=1 Tax=Nocardia sp. NBC_00508 TaxID=2975992 RepID=UPI002E80C175|nr:hypothetical protein [Nocardia sp. NBC_00508]WUD64315.1 hypothetical protein OHA40_21740 [Nocardia sp. NBC_00508]
MTEATAAGFNVADDWIVTAVSGNSDDGVQAHQTAITTALNEMVSAQDDAVNVIKQAADEVRSRGEMFGDGDPVAMAPMGLCISGSRVSISTAASTPNAPRPQRRRSRTYSVDHRRRRPTGKLRTRLTRTVTRRSSRVCHPRSEW